MLGTGLDSRIPIKVSVPKCFQPREGLSFNREFEIWWGALRGKERVLLNVLEVSERPPEEVTFKAEGWFFFLIFIYLAVSGRSWGTWDLSSRQTDSLVVGWAQYLEHSCSAAYGILVLWPGIKLVSPALQGRFLTTGPPVCAQSLFCPWDFPVKNTGVGCYFLSRGSSHWTTKEGPKAES